jgi:hypothetical protein
LAIEDTAKKLLKNVGWKVAGKDAQLYDATLKIIAEGVALGYSYSNLKNPQYTAARLYGVISFEIDNFYIHKEAFEGEVPPAKFIRTGISPGLYYSSWESASCPTPKYAPFEMVLSRSGFYSKLTNIIISLPIAGLKDEEENLRTGAAETLGKIGDKRAVESLIEALRDEDCDVRKEAAYALGEIGDKRAVEPLIAALRDEDSGVREAAASALGEIGDKRTINALKEVAKKDKNEDVREAARETIKKIQKKIKGKQK